MKVIDVLLEMRRYRMGLIQTPEQLRFSYLAIIEGSKSNLYDNGKVPSISSHISPNSHVNDENELRSTLPESSPRNRSTTSGSDEDLSLDGNEDSVSHLSDKVISSENASDSTMKSPDFEMRQRVREEKRKRTTEKIKEIKEKQKEAEKRSRIKASLVKYSSYAFGVVFLIGLGFAIYNKSIFDSSVDSSEHVSLDVEL